MKSLLTAFLAIVCFGCIPPFAPPSHQKLAYELSTKTVALVQSEHNFAYCSGVWVDPKSILTASHCVDDVEVGGYVEYAVIGDVTELPTEQKINSHLAVLADFDAVHDLALLDVDGIAPEHGVATVSHDEIHVGDTVETMGSPLGLVWSFSSGEVAAIRFLPGDEETVGIWYIQSTAPISPGNSGGGLYDDRGRLIGITRAYLPRGELINLFIHRDYIVEFLEP